MCRRLGDLSSDIGDTERAVHWWRRAAADHPDGTLLVRLAAGELALGDRDAARASVDRAAALLPDDPRVARLRRQLAAR
jgi:uncharacterized protein HemY